jgi:hypothetical protein
MKKIKLTTFFFCLTSFCHNISFSQNTSQGNGNQQWKINGNIADENHSFGNKNQFPLKLRTNDVERIRITEYGNFGIGITTLASKLHIKTSNSSQIQELQLYSLLGEKLEQNNYSASWVELNLSELEKGTYLVRIRLSDNSLHTRNIQNL